MRKYAPLLFTILFACSEPKEKQTLAQFLAKGKWIDLTYDFSSSTLYWPNNPVGFKLDTQFNGMTAGGYYYSSNAFFSPEHGGTHLDAPVHFAKGKWSADEIPLSQLTGEAVVIDVTAKTTGNPDYQITVDDVTAWEKENGLIAEGTILLFRTGWGRPHIQRRLEPLAPSSNHHLLSVKRRTPFVVPCCRSGFAPRRIAG